jgi:hypothetical protein
MHLSLPEQESLAVRDGGSGGLHRHSWQVNARSCPFNGANSGTSPPGGSEPILPAYLVGMVLAGTFLRERALVARLRGIASRS